MPSVTDQLWIMYGILVRQLFLLWQLCTVGHGIFKMANVNNFLLVNKTMLISQEIYFKTVLEWTSLA